VIRLGFSGGAWGAVPTEGWVSSERRRQRIDEEVDRLIGASHDAARELLYDHRTELEALAEALLTDEQLDRSALESVLGDLASRAPDSGMKPSQARPARLAAPATRRARRPPALAASAARALRAWREARRSGRPIGDGRPALEPELADVRSVNRVGDHPAPHSMT
jgi:hypothetical protein